MKKFSGEVFYPSEDTLKNTRVKDRDKLNKYSTENYTEFWENEAKELE